MDSKNNSNGLKIYEALANAFVAEGVDTHFTLMGDGNMHWATAMRAMEGMQTVHVRHEHCAVAMSMGYASATGKVGVSSVTCGPGFTQVMTALATAVRARVPLVVFTGEAPIRAKWYSQAIDQAPFAVACGAHYISAHAPERMYQYVREAFYVAKHERRPAVIGVPYDVQKQLMPNIGPYEPSAQVIPVLDRMPPSDRQVDLAAAKLAAARSPLILAGRGVIWSDCRTEVEELAEASGALLATTLLTRGMYDHNPFSLGISGGFARKIAREMFLKSDLIVVVGASLAYHTVDGGRIIPDEAEVIQIDTQPRGLRDGARAADHYVRADARLAVEQILARLKQHGPVKSSVRTPALAKRIATEPADDTPYDIDPGTLDPRSVFEEIEGILPQGYDTVSGSGHQSYFHTVMRGGDPIRYHAMRDFSAIGNAISYATGVAAARRNGRVVLFEGDGSLLMHIQELETIQRHGLKLLIVCSNDGAYGSEIHKLREEGVDDSGAVFGRPDFASIAQGFGLRGVNVTELGHFAELMEEYERGDTAMIWNVHVSDKVVNPRVRRNAKTGHGLV